MEASTEKVKRSFILEGLDCSNCAMKIESNIRKLKGVEDCSVSFATKTLTMGVPKAQEQELIKEATRKIKELEPHIQVMDKNARSSRRLQGGNLNGGHAHSHSHSHSQGNAYGNEEGHGAHEHDHTDDHGHDHGASNTKIMIIRLIAGSALLAAGVWAPLSATYEFVAFLLAYLMIGGDILLRSAKNISRGRVFDEHFLMSIATIGAFIIQEYPEGVAVMLFYQVGELFQSIAVNRSRKSISDLMDIRPDYANVKLGEETKRVNPEDVEIGQLIVIKPGERVPLDGKVVEGISAMDTSALTGESVPREVEPGQDVLSGFINKNGVLTVEVSKVFGESTVSKILDLVENASSKKAPTENFITKFAKYYTPVVVIVAALMAAIPPLLLEGATFSEWVYRALVFLVISCPCALVVSIPLGFFGGIGASSRNGVLVKGSNYLEALNDVKYVVFDKTGTLTKGAFTVTSIHPQSGLTKDELLRYAAYAEIHSNHPIAHSIRAAYGSELDESQIAEYNEVSGHGIQLRFEGKEILAGNRKWMEKENINFSASTDIGTIVYVAIDRTYGGYLVISDEIKEDSAKAIKALKSLGIAKTVMLTGDLKAVGEKVGQQLGIDEVRAELLPQNKVEEIEKLDSQKGKREKIAFVGDGINDTPVLARADVGIAMGGLGSDAAIEAADIVIMTDEPSKLASAIYIAKRTRRIVWQNIGFAMGVKGLFLLLGAFGVASMWEAVFADVGVTLIAVINAMRVLKTEPKL
ncbi:heavy metal translocating P-type ATPase [Paenibacillus sp. CAU 1782]